MPLTHVCMWSGKGWKKVTASEAALLHPGGTVSARSGLFMCELCGQYVSLTDGMIRDRYFKHSAEEKSKDCPERTFGDAAITTFEASVHDLPIRLNIINSSRFDIELGLISVPEKVIKACGLQKVIIQPTGIGCIPFEYSSSRLNTDTITYLSIGNRPAGEYRLSFLGESKLLQLYWPNKVEGIHSDGSLFDYVTRKKLPYDADVQIGHKYYLLTRFRLSNHYRNVEITEVCAMPERFSTWHIYEVTATSFEEETAKFFLDFHCRLTEFPITLYPVWPTYVESPYVIYHASNQVNMFMQGDAVSKVFPDANKQNFVSDNGKLLRIMCNERQQLVSAGRTKVLKYTYLRKEYLDRYATLPVVNVTDLNNKPILNGIQGKLPIRNTVAITAPFDGYVMISQKNYQVEQYELKASDRLLIDSVKFGQQIEIYQGLDCVWRTFFQRESVDNNIDDLELVRLLSRQKGEVIPIPHAIGALALLMDGYPKTKQWLYQVIRNGFVSKKAINILKTQVLMERKN